MKNLPDKITENWKSICAVAGILIIGITGFGSSKSIVQNCTATVKRYVTAENSEPTVEPSSDGEGRMTVCTDTDYWSEPASVVLSVTTVDGEILNTSEVAEVKYGVGFPPMPPHDTSMSMVLDFDRFQYHTDTSLYIGIKDAVGRLDKVSKSISYNQKCIDNLKQIVPVSTWYGINYSVGLDYDN